MSHPTPVPAAEREAILRDIASKIPAKPSLGKRRVWIACMVIGTASFAILLAIQPHRAWGAFAINTLYWLGIARYKDGHDPAQLRQRWQTLAQEYPKSEWTLRTRIPDKG